MYHIAFLSAANLHFLTGVFLHFITGADTAELEKIFVGLLAIGTGFPAICRIMKDIQKFFRVFTSLIQQRRILRVPNVGRRTGCIHDHGTTVAAPSGIISAIILLVRLTNCVKNHLIDLAQYLRRQTLAEVYHG